MDLLPGDLFFAPSSAHTAALARGVSPASLFAALRDRATAAGCGAPPLSSASELLYATGAAASLKVRGSSNLVTVLPAAVPANLKPWTVTLRLAANLRLPVIYVLQVPADHSSLAAAKLCAQADACGLPGITVDGHDAVAMLRVCQEARQKARQGYGPTLVECCCIPKSHAAPKSVHFHPAACDPLAAMQHYLERRNLWDEAWNGQISSRVAAEISVAEQALASPAPHDASPRPRPAPGTGPSPDETEQLALAEMAVFGR
jgi:pyruvate dehydrogenase E1 component alpha subunit